MIVLDTSELVGVGLGQSTALTLMRSISDLTGHPLAVPEMVEAEYLARYRRAVTNAIAVADGGSEIAPGQRDRLLSLVPWWLGRAGFCRAEPGSSLPIVDSAVGEERRRLRSIYQILPTPPNGPAEGLAREVGRRRPAVASGGAGKGARDTVVWLTALDAARAIAPSKLYFVVRDGAFGEPYLHEQLRSEAPRNLVYFTSVDRLLDRLTAANDPPEPSELLFESETVKSAVQSFLSTGDFTISLADWYPPDLRQSPLRVADEVTLLMTPHQALCRHMGDLDIVALRGSWRVDRRYLDLSSDASGSGSRGERTLSVTVRLAISCLYEDGHLSRASVLSAGGVRSIPRSGII